MGNFLICNYWVCTKHDRLFCIRVDPKLALLPNQEPGNCCFLWQSKTIDLCLTGKRNHLSSNARRHFGFNTIYEKITAKVRLFDDCKTWQLYVSLYSSRAVSTVNVNCQVSAEAPNGQTKQLLWRRPFTFSCYLTGRGEERVTRSVVIWNPTHRPFNLHGRKPHLRPFRGLIILLFLHICAMIYRWLI